MYCKFLHIHINAFLTEVDKNYRSFPKVGHSLEKYFVIMNVWQNEWHTLNRGYITILITFNSSKKNMVPYKNTVPNLSCHWEWQLSCELYHIGSLHPPGMFLSIYLFFHIRILKWRPPAFEYASHLLKIFLNTGWSSCLEILAISFKYYLSIQAKKVDCLHKLYISVSPTNSSHTKKKITLLELSAIQWILLLRQPFRHFPYGPLHCPTWSKHTLVLLLLIL
jgi:hypothetical protein